MAAREARPGRAGARDAGTGRVVARDAALRILDELFGRERIHPDAHGRLALARFQERGVARLRRILDRRGGAVLADSVGLGKTFTALALLRSTLQAGGDGVVLVPAALRASWRRALREVVGSGRHCRLASHTALARGLEVRPSGAGRLVVVDEAHRFRNPATLRYAALARLMGPGTRALLVTATPINNGPEDLYHLLRLFAPDDAFRDLGVPSLRGAFTPPAGGGWSRDLRTVIDDVVVRRTRGMLMARYGDEPVVVGARFPRRAPPRVVRYACPGLKAAAGAVAALELAPYRLLRPGPCDPRTAPSGERTVGRGVRGAGGAGGAADAGGSALVRLALLKRLDSSAAAFGASLARLECLLQAALDAAGAGRVPELRTGHRHSDDDPLQLSLVALLGRPAPPDVDLGALAASIRRDLATIRRLRGLPGADDADSKLRALRRILDGAGDDPVVVFTEYRDTAEALWRALAPIYRVGRVDGSGAWLGLRPAGRRAVVERFAPRAHGRRAPPDRERVDVLVATDVLAEGLNLQDARHVISYDLPWNPVRLLQRIGRVDRMGSPHTEIVPYLFAPASGLESVLGLTRRLRGKLGSITATVGAEHAGALHRALAASPDPARALESVLVEVEDAAGSAIDQLRTLWLRALERAPWPAGAAAPSRQVGPVGSVGSGVGSAGRVGSVGPTSPVAPIARLAVASDSPAAKLAWVVVVRVAESGPGGATRPLLLQVSHEGGAGEGGEEAVAALRAALAADDVAGALSGGGPPGSLTRRSEGRRDPPALPAAAIDELLRTRALGEESPPGLPGRDPGRRLARVIQGRLEAEGAGLDPRLLHRADRLLQRLAVPLHPRSVESVASLDAAPPPTLSRLLDAAERALRGSPAATSISTPRDTATWTLRAALQIEPGGGP